MRRFPVFLSALLITSASFAGVVYEVETTDSSSSPAKVYENQMTIDGQSIKMGAAAGDTSDSDSEMIFRGDRREMIVVDHDDHSYYVIDEATMKEMNGFPVVTREFGDDGSLEHIVRLKSSTRCTLEPATFEPPAGYKRKDMFKN